MVFESTDVVAACRRRLSALLSQKIQYVLRLSEQKLGECHWYLSALT